MTLDARLAARDDLRFTPAGLAALDFQLAHESMQTEANGERRVACELAAEGGDLARLYARVKALAGLPKAERDTALTAAAASSPISLHAPR